MTALPTRLALQCYAQIKKTGILEVPFMQSAFLRCYFLYKRYFEDPFYSLTKRHPGLFQGGNILDIGANMGYTTSVFAPVLKGSLYKVFSFEPEDKNYASLLEVVKAFGIQDHVVPLKMAVGSADGEIQLHINEAHHGDHRVVTENFKRHFNPADKTCTVPLTSIDSFVQSRNILNAVSFIKIDVQGYEYHVLQGMEETIAANPNLVIAFEYSETDTRELGFEPGSILEFFLSKGFQLYHLTRHSDVEPFDPNALALAQKQRSYVDLLASRNVLIT